MDSVIDVKVLEKDNKILRALMLKERYADVIFKSQQQLLGEEFDGKEMKKKVALREKQLQEEKVKSQRERERKAARFAIASIKRTVSFDDGLQAEKELLAIMSSSYKLQQERDRKAARIAIASIKRTVDFDDAIQAERELLAIMGSSYKSLMIK